MPQARERLFFIGVRSDLNKPPVFPKPLPYYYTLADAIPYIDKVKLGGKPNSWRIASERPSPTITQSGAMRSQSGYFDGGGWVEAEEKRKFSIAELKQVCSFPNDFQLTGTFEKQWERIGRAVPPLMARAIAETIRDTILCKEKIEDD
jgi:DNA (cytosine-5)-methyltransferase 1